MIFENNVLQHVAMEEGRVRLNGSAWAFDYFIKDHLGNVRAMLAENGTVLEETHYYPFGLVQKGISTLQTGALHNKEKTFQNQQIDKDLDLNWVQFKWRNHDPQIGRFIEIDPLSDEYVYNSTYAFSENKVVRHVELEGLEAQDAIINRAWRELQSGFQKFANFFDGFENTVGVSVEKSNATNTKSVETQASVTVSLNAGEYMNYIIVNNSSEGFPKSIMNVKSDLKVINNDKSEQNTQIGKVTGKISTDQKRNVTTTEAVEVNTRRGIVGAEVKQSKDGVTVKGSLSKSVGNTKAKGSIIYDNQKNSTGAGVEMRLEQKAGQFKFSFWNQFIYRTKKQ